MNEEKLSSIIKEEDEEIEEGEIIDDDDNDKLVMISDGELVDGEDDEIYKKKLKSCSIKKSNVSWRSSSASSSSKKRDKLPPKQFLSISQRWERENLMHSPTSSSRSSPISSPMISLERKEKMYKMISIDQSFMNDSSFKKKVLCERYKNDPRHRYAANETEFRRFNATSNENPSSLPSSSQPSKDNHELSHDTAATKIEPCFSPLVHAESTFCDSPSSSLLQIPIPKMESQYTPSFSTPECTPTFFNHSAPIRNNEQPNVFFGASAGYQHFPPYSASVNPLPSSNSPFINQSGYNAFPYNFDQNPTPRFDNNFFNGSQRYCDTSSHNNNHHGFHPYSNNNGYNRSSNYHGNTYDLSQSSSRFGQSGPADHPYHQRRRRRGNSDGSEHHRRGDGRVNRGYSHRENGGNSFETFGNKNNRNNKASSSRGRWNNGGNRGGGFRNSNKPRKYSRSRSPIVQQQQNVEMNNVNVKKECKEENANNSFLV